MPPTSRSISPASRTLIGLTSNPSDGATDWITASWPTPAAAVGSEKIAARHVWRDLLEQLQPFPTQSVFVQDETGGIAARPRQTVDKAEGVVATVTAANTIGTARLAWSSASTDEPLGGEDGLRRERDQFRCVCAHVVGITCGPAHVNAHVAAIGPAKFLQPLQERSGGGSVPRIAPRTSLPKSTPMRRIWSGCWACAVSGSTRPRRRREG